MQLNRRFQCSTHGFRILYVDGLFLHVDGRMLRVDFRLLRVERGILQVDGFLCVTKAATFNMTLWNKVKHAQLWQVDSQHYTCRRLVDSVDSYLLEVKRLQYSKVAVVYMSNVELWHDESTRRLWNSFCRPSLSTSRAHRPTSWTQQVACLLLLQ